MTYVVELHRGRSRGRFLELDHGRDAGVTRVLPLFNVDECRPDPQTVDIEQVAGSGTGSRPV